MSSESWSKWRDPERGPEWADGVLRDGFNELKNNDLDSGSRIVGVLIKIRLLKDQGYLSRSKELHDQLLNFWHFPEAFLTSTPSSRKGVRP